MPVMLIDGDSMDETKAQAALWSAKSDESCQELELQGVDLDYELTSVIIQVLESKKWQSVRISLCQGLVNDVVTACMAHKVESFSLQVSINDNIMNTLAYGLNYSTSLIRMQLSGRLSGNETSNFAKAIARNANLKELDLSDCTIDTQCLGILGFALRINRTIRTIVLNGCYLEDENLAHLLSALQDSPALKSLSVQRNYCHEQSMSMISSLLHFDDIEELNMSYLLRKKKEAQPEVVALQDVSDEPDEPLAETPEAAKLNDSKGAGKEAEGDRRDTQDPSPGAADAGVATKEEETHGAHEPDNEPGPEAEAGNQARNTSLKNLQLAANGLNDGFVESTLNIFGKDSALQELNLFGNRMTDLSIYRIISKLPVLKKLKSLWIGHNNFTAEGYNALLLAMQSNYVIEELSIITINTEPEVQEIQNKIDYFTRLNRGGRRIFASDVSDLPKSIWPLILERANRIEWDDGDENVSKSISYSADAIFCLLQGPALLGAS